MSFQEKAAEGQSGFVFVMALVFVFFILAAQYESWSLPFQRSAGYTLGDHGGYAGTVFKPACLLISYVNNVFAQIGLVMLIGLNAKNAISDR